ISQRPQDVNKKALELSACVFAFNTTGTNAVKAMNAWLGTAEAEGLQSLQQGECVVWSPSWLRFHGKLKIFPKQTFHARYDPASETVSPGRRKPRPRTTSTCSRLESGTSRRSSRRKSPVGSRRRRSRRSAGRRSARGGRCCRSWWSGRWKRPNG